MTAYKKATQVINPHDRALTIDDLEKARDYLRDTVSTLLSVNVAGLDRNEHIFLMHRRDTLRKMLKDIELLISQLTRRQPAGHQKPGLITVGNMPNNAPVRQYGYFRNPETPKNHVTAGSEMHHQIDGKWSIFPDSAITFDKSADYTDVHNQLGCIDCKNACRQYLRIGPACNQARTIQKKVNPDGKCTDHKPTTK